MNLWESCVFLLGMVIQPPIFIGSMYGVCMYIYIYMYLELVDILLHPNMAIAGKSPKIQEEMHLQSWWIFHCHVFLGGMRLLKSLSDISEMYCLFLYCVFVTNTETSKNNWQNHALKELWQHPLYYKKKASYTIYQFLNFLAVKQLTTGSQPNRSPLFFSFKFWYLFPKIAVGFLGPAETSPSNPSEFGCLDFRLLHLSLQTFLSRWLGEVA